MQQETSQEFPAEGQAQLAQMHQITDIMAQAMTRALIQIQQQPAASPPAVQPPQAEQPEESADLLDDLEDLDLTEEGLADLFDIEEVEDPSIQALSRGLEDIDLYHLSEKCREVAVQLRKCNSLPAGLPHRVPVRLAGSAS
jgi:hypothetical protein